MTVFAAPAVAADAPLLLSWDDLVPVSEPLADPLEGSPIDLRYDLGFIARVKADTELGFLTEESQEYQEAKTLREKYAAEGVDVDEMIKAVLRLDDEIDRRNELVVDELEGEFVKLPGYALPLETTETGVREFLLVPYVGACIHTPPPPPNQMVFVTLDKAYRVENLFDPVWITGRIKVQSASRSLSYVDGEAQIATGYTLSGVAVEPFE